MQSPWAEVDQALLDRAAKVLPLPLSGTDMIFWTNGEYLRFARYGDVWCVVEEGSGTPSCKGGFVGSCMAGERIIPILRRLIEAQRPKQLDLFA